jgi:uncharacterized protein (TIGR03503 family)
MKIIQFALVLVVLFAGNNFTVADNDAASINSGDIDNTQLIPDVRVIIDISGSMKHNDPNNLRKPALELLVKLFPEGSKAGVWTFGQWVNNLVPSESVNKPWRDNAFAKAASINSVALRTNIPEALLKAVDDIKKLDPVYKVNIILLTDGMVDVSKSSADNHLARQRIIEEILPEIKAAGITIHTVALSQHADQELMDLLASETNGLAAVAETSEDLTRIFLQAFDASVVSQQLPLEGNTFSVDSSIDEFTALVFRQSGTPAATFTAPDGRVYSIDRQMDNVNWFSQQNYDLVTVKNPLAGTWSIQAELEVGSRVTIVSNLSLKVNSLAKSNFKGARHKLVAALNEDDDIIIRPEFLNLVDMSVTVERRDDGHQWYQSLSEINPIPDDGRFIDELAMFQQGGIYDVVVDAVGKTFKRQYKQTLAVRERYDIRIATVAGTQPSFKLTLFARNSAIDSNSADVTAQIIYPDGSSRSVNTTPNGNRRWLTTLSELDQSGVYKVYFTINGRLTSGETFAEESHVELFEHRIEGMEFITPEPEPEPEKTIEPVLEVPPEENVKPRPATEAQISSESVDSSQGYKKIAFYSAIAIANVLILGLVFFAYKMVKGASQQSSVLDEDDALKEDLAEEASAPVAPEEEPSSEVDSDGDQLAQTDMPSLESESEDNEADQDLEPEVDMDLLNEQAVDDENNSEPQLDPEQNQEQDLVPDVDDNEASDLEPLLDSDQELEPDVNENPDQNEDENPDQPLKSEDDFDLKLPDIPSDDDEDEKNKS